MPLPDAGAGAAVLAFDFLALALADDLGADLAADLDHVGRDAEPRERLGEQRLAAAGRADQQDIALLQLNIILGCLYPLVVIVNSDSYYFFCFILPYYVLIHIFLHFLGLHKVKCRFISGFLRLFLLLKNLKSLINTIVANMSVNPRHHQIHILLLSPAKRASNLRHAIFIWYSILRIALDW